MKTLAAYFSLIRVPNCLMAALATAVGQYLSPVAAKLDLSPQAMAVSFFVCGFGNILNDIRDIETDRVNHPQRALPSGRLTIGAARTTAFLFLAISLGLMLWLSDPGRVIVVVALILLVWYNLKLKHTAYRGNITVSLLGALAFLQGGAVGGLPGIMVLPGPAIPAVFAFLMHCGREIIKDIEDIAGDRRTGSRTAPVVSGTRRPLIIAYILFAVLICLSIVVFILGWFNIVYLAVTMPLVILPLIGQAFWLGVSPDRTRCRMIGILVKWEMLAGILALIVGKAY